MPVRGAGQTKQVAIVPMDVDVPAPRTTTPKAVPLALERTGSGVKPHATTVAQALGNARPRAQETSSLVIATNLTELAAAAGNRKGIATMTAYAEGFESADIPNGREVLARRDGWLKANAALRDHDPEKAAALFADMGLPGGAEVAPATLKTYLALGAATFDVPSNNWLIAGDNPRLRAIEGQARQAALLADMKRHGIDEPRLDAVSIAHYYAALPAEQHAAAQQRIIEASLVHARQVSHREDLKLPELREGFDTLMRSQRYGGRAVVDCEGFAAARLLTLPPGFTPVALVVADAKVPGPLPGHEIAVYRDPQGAEWVASNGDPPRPMTATAIDEAFAEMAARSHKSLSEYTVNKATGASATEIIDAARHNQWSPPIV